MRLDEYLRQDNSSKMSEAAYRRLIRRACFSVVRYDYRTDTWDTSELDKLTEEEARERIKAFRQVVEYEQANNVTDGAILGFIVSVIDEDINPPPPEWPEELKGYDTGNFPVAYLSHKFGIEPPEKMEAEYG